MDKLQTAWWRAAEETRIWNSLLDENCCTVDARGNRPCDNGMLCDKCSAPWLDDLYHERLQEAASRRSLDE